MEIHGRIFMEIYGKQWKSIRNRRKSMEESPWKSTENHGTQWEIHEIHGKQYKSIEIHGRKSMKIYGKQWKSMEESTWESMRNHEI